MSHRPRYAPFSILCAVALFPLACTSLTSPPEPEDIAPAASGGAASAPGSSGPGQVASIRNPHAPPPDTAAAPEGKLEVSETAAGKGAPAQNGDSVTVNYVGKLTDGKIFDQSRGKPFTFKLGAGNVIKGWDQGLLGMKAGAKRTLTIPPSLAYGARGFPPAIPPSSTLVFDVEMVSIAPGGGAVLYQPAPDFGGVETFTYTVSDGNGGTTSTTVTVTVPSPLLVTGADAGAPPHVVAYGAFTRKNPCKPWGPW